MKATAPSRRRRGGSESRARTWRRTRCACSRRCVGTPASENEWAGEEQEGEEQEGEEQEGCEGFWRQGVRQAKRWRGREGKGKKEHDTRAE
eukprot:2281027-Pleurochrysis_carterae.AAC.1